MSVSWSLFASDCSEALQRRDKAVQRNVGTQKTETQNGTPARYVNFARVARDRVSARRNHKSERKRGPACPVCSG